MVGILVCLLSMSCVALRCAALRGGGSNADFDIFRLRKSTPYSYDIVDCETLLGFAERPIKIFKKCKIRTRFVESTSLLPQCFICSIFNA